MNFFYGMISMGILTMIILFFAAMTILPIIMIDEDKFIINKPALEYLDENILYTD